MDLIPTEAILLELIMAYALMSGIFIISQGRGQTFMASFDTAVKWGSGLFIIGYCLNIVVYAVWV